MKDVAAATQALGDPAPPEEPAPAAPPAPVRTAIEAAPDEGGGFPMMGVLGVVLLLAVVLALAGSGGGGGEDPGVSPGS
jgi:hypothetical protein